MPRLLRHSLLTVALWTSCSCATLTAQDPQGVEREAELAASQLFDEAAELQRLGRHDGALAAYHQLIAGSPAGELRTAAVLRAAQLHCQLRHGREAQLLYGQLLAESPDGPHAAECLAVLGTIDTADGQTVGAAESYRELLEKFPQSPQAPNAAYWLARYAADENDTAQADHYVRWLLKELDPEQYSAKGRRKLWAQAVCLRCQLAAAEHEWDLIQDIAAEALPYLPAGAEQVRVEFWRAEAEFRTDQFDAARDRFAALDPRTVGIAEPWVAIVPLRRAQLAARRGQWGEVLEFVARIERDQRDFPFPTELDYLRGRALAGRGDMNAARAAYQEILNHAAEANPQTVVLAQWMIGETYFEQRAYTQARAAYLELIERPAPADWQVRAALQVGKCLELEDRWDDAQQLYQQALDQWAETETQPQLAARLKWAEAHTRTRR